MILADKLTKEERLRLECFAQAINSGFTIEVLSGHRPTLNDLFDQAKQIEEFLKAANLN